MPSSMGWNGRYALLLYSRHFCYLEYVNFLLDRDKRVFCSNDLDYSGGITTFATTGNDSDDHLGALMPLSAVGVATSPSTPSLFPSPNQMVSPSSSPRPSRHVRRKRQKQVCYHKVSLHIYIYISKRPLSFSLSLSLC